jgi:hypothetical protein
MKTENLSSENVTANGVNPLLGNVFSLFTGFDKYRPVFDNPFEQNGRIYATDAHVLIRIDKSKIQYDNEKILKVEQPNCEAIVPEKNCDEIVTVNAELFEQYKTEDELVKQGEDVECGLCNGEGTMTADYHYKGKWYKSEHECPVCDGSGYEEEGNLVRTGNKTFKNGVRVKFNGCLYEIHRFYKLIEVQKLTGGEIRLLHKPEKYKAPLFSIGDFEIIIMPSSACESDCEAILNVA